MLDLDLAAGPGSIKSRHRKEAQLRSNRSLALDLHESQIAGEDRGHSSPRCLEAVQLLLDSSARQGTWTSCRPV